MEQKQSTVVMCDRRHCIPRRLSRGQVSVNVGDLGYVTEKERFGSALDVIGDFTELIGSPSITRKS